MDNPKKPKRSLETLVAQAGRHVDPITGSVIPPIHTSTTFARDKNYQLIREETGYTRDENPMFEGPEEMITALEGGEDALLFSSGMAAITALFRSLSKGDHIVAPSKMYFEVVRWLKYFSEKHEVGLTFFDPSDPSSLENAIEPGRTKMVWIETPANPTWDVTDIGHAAKLAHKVGAVLGVDSTVPTPVLTQPLNHGADFVFHSASKYLNGHSDVISGLLVTKEQNEIWEAVKFDRHHTGSILGPIESWLLLRGLRTLFVRVERACESAMKIATHFHEHKKLDQVLYPGLATHPGHEVANRQMKGGFGGMLSFLVKGGASEAIKVATQLKVFVPATSLGGVESLVEHRKTAEGPESPTPDHLLRLSIGLENVDDLIADLEQALESL
jgi:cystathionine gamma-synthase